MRRLAGMAVVLMFAMVVGGLYAGCAKKTNVEPAMGPETTMVQPKMEPVEEPVEAPGDEGTEPAEDALAYVCPEHAEETSDAPAKCSVCEAYMVAGTDEVVEYVCPAHDVVQDEPGECEECDGMILIARVVGGDDDDDDDDDEATGADEGSGDDDDDDGDDDDDDGEGTV